MILVFGGTTEGRRAVEVLEEAGSLYYYSTRSDGQQVELLHGVRLEGDLDVPKMIALCRSHDIRLIVDAAHPFAQELHTNLLYTARHIGAPIIRYDRIYPKRSDDLAWCKDYREAMERMEAEGIHRLLALTGVNNIGTLRPYWEKAENECWVRILNRRFSQFLARKSRFPEDHLVFYEHDDTATLLQQLRPQAILTKESGLSGGFMEKVEAAREAGVKVMVIMRPEYPPHTPVPQNVRIVTVNGPHGLRRAVEQLLPDFFALKSGLTTGTCATAAAVAATMRYIREKAISSPPHREGPGEGLPTEVPVMLPNGETIHVPVGYGDGYVYCIKQAGDDPDVTNGIEIRATVTATVLHGSSRKPEENREQPCRTVAIEAGEGIGRFTLPGFDYPPGEPAINKGPRQMIRQNLEKLITPLSLGEGLGVRLSIPGGADIARRTFNPRLGIEGGISIIGVSGIVKPFSEEAFIGSIRKCMQVAKASATGRVVLNSGAKSERFLKSRYPTLPLQAFVQYGNYIGQALSMAAELQFAHVTLGVMLGKAVKLAEGHLDTHSRRATMNRDFVRQLLTEAHCQLSIVNCQLSKITLARELWDLLPADRIADFARVVIAHCMAHCRPLLASSQQLTILLIDDDGHIYQ